MSDRFGAVFNLESVVGNVDVVVRGGGIYRIFGGFCRTFLSFVVGNRFRTIGEVLEEGM